jgi:iron complex transport system substrate-binding protein
VVGRVSVVAGAVLVALATLAGCASAPTEASGRPEPATEVDAPPGPTQIPAGMGAAESEGTFPRTITHFGGTTTIPAPPQRIVVIATGQTDAILTLGVVPVGVAHGDDADLVPRYVQEAFPQHAEQLAAVASVGSRQTPNLEAIAALRPDLVLANAAASQELYPVLAEIAPTVLVEGTGVNWKQDFLLLADSLGMQDHAQAFLDGFAADAAALGAAAGEETVSFVRVTADRTRMFGLASFIGFVAWDAGLVRPESQRFDATSRDLSPEELALAAGDRIYYSVQGATTEAQAAASATLGNPLWQTLPAVRGGRAVLVDDDPWYLNAGPTAARLVLGDLETTLGAGES